MRDGAGVEPLQYTHLCAPFPHLLSRLQQLQAGASYVWQPDLEALVLTPPLSFPVLAAVRTPG